VLASLAASPLRAAPAFGFLVAKQRVRLILTSYGSIRFLHFCSVILTSYGSIRFLHFCSNKVVGM
jgi:hypothetical protein